MIDKMIERSRVQFRGRDNGMMKNLKNALKLSYASAKTISEIANDFSGAFEQQQVYSYW